MERYQSITYAIIQICWLFKQRGTNLKPVYNDYVNIDMKTSVICVINAGSKDMDF